MNPVRNVLSDKQWEVMCFGETDYDALICDGAVRSGKTSIISVAYVEWAMEHFDLCNFIIGGVSVESAKRNVVNPMTATQYLSGQYSMKWSGSSNCLTVRGNGRANLFYVFGGKDEASYKIVQGLTAAGCLLDEVALMPRSFVEQCMARCSVDGAKFWFSCNPGPPNHWFNVEWIKKAKEKNAYHIHFLLTDNPSLSERTVKRYESMYSGVFYLRYILGIWAMAEGLIYPNHQKALEQTWAPKEGEALRGYCISCDYGTNNPFHALKWKMDRTGHWHCVAEWRHSGRDTHEQMTDADYVNAMKEFCSDAPAGQVEIIVDPSASSFIAALRKAAPFNDGECTFKVRKAKNDVMDGLRHTDECMCNGRIRISQDLTHLMDEFALYVWDDKTEDKPKKENDHGMDALRYFVETKRAYKQVRNYVSRFGE